MRNWILLISLGVIWGASFLGAKLALGDFGPILLAALRLAIGAAVLVAFMWFMRLKAPGFTTSTDRRIWLHIIAMAAFTNAIPFTLLNWAQLTVTSGFAGITMAVVPLLVLPLAHFLLPDDKMGPRRILGFVIGFVGVVVLIGPAAFFEGDSAALPRLACVFAAACYAIGSINTRLCPPVSTISYSALGLAIGTVMLLPIALLSEGLPATMPGATAWMGAVYLGLFPTAAATLMLVAIITSAGPTFMSLVNYQVPVWAVIFGMLFLGEALPGSFAIALTLILVGLGVSQLRFLKKSPQPE